MFSVDGSHEKDRRLIVHDVLSLVNSCLLVSTILMLGWPSIPCHGRKLRRVGGMSVLTVTQAVSRSVSSQLIARVILQT